MYVSWCHFTCLNNLFMPYTHPYAVRYFDKCISPCVHSPLLRPESPDAAESGRGDSGGLWTGDEEVTGTGWTGAVCCREDHPGTTSNVGVGSIICEGVSAIPCSASGTGGIVRKAAREDVTRPDCKGVCRADNKGVCRAEPRGGGSVDIGGRIESLGESLRDGPSLKETTRDGARDVPGSFGLVM